MAKNRYFTYEPKPRKIMNEEKWIATLRQNKMCSLEDIAKEISSRTTIAPGEVEAVITDCLFQIGVSIKSGEGVEIDGLGTFFPRVISKTVEDVKDASLKNCVKSITVGFRPDSRLRKAVKSSGLKKFEYTDNYEEE
jgi:predicted histone-like DNA-binding protein